MLSEKWKKGNSLKAVFDESKDSKPLVFSFSSESYPSSLLWVSQPDGVCNTVHTHYKLTLLDDFVSKEKLFEFHSLNKSSQLEFGFPDKHQEIRKHVFK